MTFLPPPLFTHKMRISGIWEQYWAEYFWKVERILFLTQQLYDSLKMSVRPHHVTVTPSSRLATSPGANLRLLSSQALQDSVPPYTAWLFSAPLPNPLSTFLPQGIAQAALLQGLLVTTALGCSWCHPSDAYRQHSFGSYNPGLPSPQPKSTGLWSIFFPQLFPLLNKSINSPFYMCMSWEFMVSFTFPMKLQRRVTFKYCEYCWAQGNHSVSLC